LEEKGGSATVIHLDKPVHFSLPDGGDVLIAPGDYAVEASGQAALLIRNIDLRQEFNVQAVVAHHEAALTRRVAVITPNEQDPDIMHIVLAEPDGSAREASGSLTGVRSRAGSSTVRLPSSSLNAAILSSQGKVATTVPSGAALNLASPEIAKRSAIAELTKCTKGPPGARPYLRGGGDAPEPPLLSASQVVNLVTIRPGVADRIAESAKLRGLSGGAELVDRNYLGKLPAMVFNGFSLSLFTLQARQAVLFANAHGLVEGGKNRIQLRVPHFVEDYENYVGLEIDITKPGMYAYLVVADCPDAGPQADLYVKQHLGGNEYVADAWDYSGEAPGRKQFATVLNRPLGQHELYWTLRKLNPDYNFDPLHPWYHHCYFRSLQMELMP